MDKLVQLQAALRAIETGQRLESVDGVLVRQVLLQPRVQSQQATPEPDAKDLYRELLALRRVKTKAKANSSGDHKGAEGQSGNDAATRPAKRLSPKKTTTIDARLESAPVSPKRGSFNNKDKDIAEELAASTTETIELMEAALMAREKELRRSEKGLARADAELREELTRAEKILPSKFLFERNMASDRALEAARNVLRRFQHRCYKLYFSHWWGTTLELRLQAQLRAAAKIMRVYRGHQCRREARRLRREVRIMQGQKRQLLAFRIKYRSSQAVKIQMAWRRFLRNRGIKHRQTRQAAVSLLQRVYRTRQCRCQSLVSALANTRKLFVAVSLQKLYRGHRTRRKLEEAQQRQRQEERVQLELLQNMSKQARAAWVIKRRGAGYLIAHQAIFPYAMRLRWHRLLDQLRRQSAAKCISRAVCRWFGVEARREAARAKQVSEWLALVQCEHKRSRNAAVLIQKHLRRWVQQRKFLVAQARRKKLARRTRLADKARRMEQAQRSKGPGRGSSDLKPSVGNSSVGRKTSRFTSSNGLNPQPSRTMSLLKPIQLKDGKKKVVRRTEGEAAVVLQRRYRHYRARKRSLLITWRNEAHKVEIRVIQRRKAATEIQRRVRGFHGRKFARQRRAERLLLRFILRWEWRRIQQRQRAARKIGRWLKLKRVQQLARLWSLEKQKRLSASIRIQRWYYVCCLLPSRLKRVLRILRKRDETFVFCDQSLQICRQHKADEFVVQSFGASLEDALRPLLSDLATVSRSPLKSKASPTKLKVGAAITGKHSAPVAFPILQMAFLVTSGWKMPFVWRELDGKTIFQTKLERAKAVAFFRSLSKRGKPVAHQIQQSAAVEASPAGSSPTRRNPKPAAKGAKGSTAVETFSSVDVDVAVARATGGAKGALDFAAFVRVIGQLGEIALQQPQGSSPYWGRFDGADARVLALMWVSLLPHSTMQPLALQFEAYVSSELFRHAAYLQRLFTRQHNKLRGMAMLVEIRRNLRNEALSHAAVLLQTQARKLLARRQLRHRMQETYEKFFDPTWGLPYWMNPRSGYSTWQKPTKLGAEDVRCEPVPYPPPERTLKAPCNGRKDCERCAEWVCYDCDEFFCRECFEEYHKANAVPKYDKKAKEEILDVSLSADAENGEDDNLQSAIKREHELERLLLCGLCKFQLASRRCLNCIPKLESKPESKLPRSAQQQEKNAIESLDNGDEGRNTSESLFCDVCFGFLHRRGGLKTHRTEPLLEICASCVHDCEDDKQPPSHNQPSTGFSIPGAGNAVQWECEACGDPPRRVCGRCAAQSHPTESCGELRPVPLQTLGRRQRTKRLQEEQEARDRADLDKMRARALRARQERCARKLQAFWRSQAPILRARRLVAARRKEKSEQWVRRQEDSRLAKRIPYRAKHSLGIAPPLSTDSPVERRLRSLHALARRQLSIRARFFGMLIDEYVTVGVPLPGLGLLHPGSNEVWTSEDLRGWIRNQQTIRFKKLTPQQAQPAERALCAWRQLERWGKLEVADDQGDTLPESSTQPEAPDATWLADVHAKQAITESMVPLAQAYDPPLPKKKRRKAADEEDVVEDVPVAMFLVEFSLDAKRTVWINHSLAERFWEWKRLKLLTRSERVAQRKRAQEYEKQHKELEAKRKQEERNLQDNAATAADTQGPSDIVEDVAAFDLASSAAPTEPLWPTSNAAWTTNEMAMDQYYNYYPAANPADTTEAWTGYDAYSASYPTGNDYGYGSAALDTYPATTGDTADLVDSGHYYANGGYAGNDSNGSGASNWYGTEYSAYEMSGYSPAPTDYNYYAAGSNNSDWDSYSGLESAGGSGNYVESQPPIDPNAAWSANDGDTGYAYNSTEQWQQSDYAQAEAISSYPSAANSSLYNVSASSYILDLPSAAGDYYPNTFSGDEQAFSSASQSASAAQWEEVFDPATKQTYYVNRLTNETAWELPATQS